MFSRRLFKIKMHSRRVFLLKTSLPVFAFLLTATIMVWPALTAQKDKFTLPKKPTSDIQASRIDMERVRFFSMDDKNQPMTVTATTIQETDTDNRVVTLSNPIAEYLLSNGVKITGKTPYGLAYQKEERMLFEKKVTATTTNGYTMTAFKVWCNYHDNSLDSDENVKINGPAGSLNANGFTLLNKGDEILFKKNTKTHIIQKEPVDITSTNGLRIDQLKQTITATENVVVTQTKKIIKSDTMMAYYTNGTKGKKQLDRIIATGNVEAFSSDGKQKITGNDGVYDPKTGIITMTGDVKVSQGASVINSDSAKMDLNKETVSLNMDKKSDRIKGTLIPSELEKGMKNGQN